MIPYLVPKQRAEIDDVLESAVVLSWPELVKASRPAVTHGVVHVEYGTAPEPSLQYVKIWLSPKRGTWELICEYWISACATGRPAVGLTFSNGYHSASLAEFLQEMMLHRDGFPNSLAGHTGVSLILVHTPTADDEQKAKACISDAYQRIGLAYPEPAGMAA